MKPQLINYLCCPSTKQPLRLVAEESEGTEVITGKLVVQGSNEQYPIIKGIPRFVFHEKEVYSNYTKSFGHQWNHYNWLRDEDGPEFEAITDRKIADFRGLSILDAGCGGGRIARLLAPDSRLYIGVDYSHACERASVLCRRAPNAHFIQADVARLPLRSNLLFDFVFSHGVLHHSPNTKNSFTSLPGHVKPGGELYIAVFQKAVCLLRWSDSLLRFVVNKLPLGMQEAFCRSLVGLQRLPQPSFWKRFLWFSLQKNAEIATFCNYDWYAPKYHREHTAVEVMNWFAEFGFHDIQFINAWPYCPSDRKYAIPSFVNSFRLGQLVGVIGKRRAAAGSQPRGFARAA
jgi:SAM-dependent methyltransferase